MKILIFYSLITSSSCTTCISTLGFCIIIYVSILWVISQYYFVLQNLHKAFPNIILFYIMKLYYKYIAIHHYIINFAQKKSQYYLLQNLHYKYIYIQQILSQKNFYIHHFFYTENFFIHRNFYIQHTFTQKHFYI